MGKSGATEKSKNGVDTNRVMQILLKYGVYLMFLLIVILLLITNASFRSLNNATNVMLQVSSYAVLGVGMTLVIMTGGIDVSVGATMVVSASVYAVLTQNHGWSEPAGAAYDSGGGSGYGTDQWYRSGLPEYACISGHTRNTVYRPRSLAGSDRRCLIPESGKQFYICREKKHSEYTCTDLDCGFHIRAGVYTSPLHCIWKKSHGGRRQTQTLQRYPVSITEELY